MASTFLTETTAKRPRSTKPQPVQDQIQLDEQPQILSKWEKLLSKISFNPNDPHHYQKLPLKPGFSFYKVLATSNFQNNSLKVPIPESLIAVDGSYVYIYYDEKAGCMKKIVDKSISEYEAQLVKINKQMISEFDEKFFGEKLDVTKNLDMPFSISKLIGEYDYQSSNYVANYQDFLQKKTQSMSDNIIEQRYLISRGWKMSVLRLCYFTRNSKCQKANYGYRITNNYSLFEDSSKKLAMKKKWQFQPTDSDSFTVQRVSGGSLNDYERMAERTVLFLEKVILVVLFTVFKGIADQIIAYCV